VSQSTIARAAEGEILVAAKLHSARETDLADVLAMVPEVDFRKVESHLDRGDGDALQSQLNAARAFVKDGGLDHRFKSLFGKSAASPDDIESLVSFLERQLD